MTEPMPGDAFQIGDVLNNTYRIEALLGRGGTSDVYRARNEISGRQVAVKVLKAEFSGNEDYLVLMTREEEIREIRHDAIVRYSENNRTSEGLVYLLMDYIEGPGLDEKLLEGPMDADDLLVLCKRVSEGLKAAHDRAIVHRDLSPDNIILRGGDPAQAVVIDFGIAKDTNPGAATIVGNEFAGKYAYAAPEQLSGNTDARSDIYSLGALILANFRGAPPDIGANPMEVVQNKKRPLNTDGVPEPLKSLLDRMTAPEPADRFQTMDGVLAFLRGEDVSEPLSEATVIAAPPKEVLQPKAPPPPPPAAKKPKEVAEKKSGSGGLIAAVLAVLLLGGGSAAWFGGFLGGGTPAHPAVSPFALVIENSEDFPASASGYVPDAEMQAALVGRIGDLGGEVDLTLASGEIAPSWATDVMSVVEDLAPLEEWQLSLRDNVAAITGTTSDADLLAGLSAKYPGNWPGALSGTFDVALKNLFLSGSDVALVLQQLADCGPLLQVNDPGPVGYGPEDPVLISGTLSSAETQQAIQEALEDIADDRFVIIDAEILNPTLCLVENFLPDAPESDVEIKFSDGDTGDQVVSGRFVVGQNPVIDVEIPEFLTTGFLSVSVLDVSGNVHHLIPNISRRNNAVETLREGQNGQVSLRVAYTTKEARESGKLALTVDGDSLGKSKIIVLHSDAPLFRQMRPTTESAVGYTEALSERSADEFIQSLDTKILTTLPRP